MDKKKMLLFGLMLAVGLVIWGPIVTSLLRLLVPDAEPLLIYLVNKGLFVAVLLPVMGLYGGLKFFGMERGSNWWFLVPALPILLLTALVFVSPSATFGLSIAAALGWILVAVFVGIAEESVFRGVLWRAFEPRGIVVTSLATSALFGAAHLMGFAAGHAWEIVLSHVVFAFGVGMMFAAVRLVSGSLFAPIVLHAVFDAGALVAAGGVNELFEETMSVETLLAPGLFFAVWGLVGILIIKKKREKESTQVVLQTATTE